MKSFYWSLVFMVAAAAGIMAGYVLTLALSPQLLPPVLRLGSITRPTTILVLGVDLNYSQDGHNKPLLNSFNGRSDTILVVHLDPIGNRLSVLSIPRDTLVSIPGHGMQKINAANAYGGPYLASQTVSNLLGTPIDHYLTVSLQGFVRAVNELGGVTVEIPARMRYIDWTAKLNIDLTPGPHTLTGNQAMGFVRFRHTALGDIGRVQRQQIFLKSLLSRVLKPDTWSHLPAIFQIAQESAQTDMNGPAMLGVIAFVRAVPRQNQFMVMLPGTFAADNSGNWIPDLCKLPFVVAKLTGTILPCSSKSNAAVTVSIQNDSAYPGLGRKLAQYLQLLGYTIVSVVPSRASGSCLSSTRIIAEQANPEDAQRVIEDLKGTGMVGNESTGDIDAAVTVLVGNDLAPMFSEPAVK